MGTGDVVAFVVKGRVDVFEDNDDDDMDSTV